jgi:hypothetical protein
MIGKTTRLVMIGVACGVLALGTTAQAKTVAQAVQEGLGQISATTIWPIILEDDDGTMVRDATSGGVGLFGNTTNQPGVIDWVGDAIYGVVIMQALQKGAPVDTTNIVADGDAGVDRDTLGNLAPGANGWSGNDGSQQITKAGTLSDMSGVNELTGVYEFVATGVINRFQNPADGSAMTWITFGPGNLNQLLIDETGVNHNLQANTTIALFEDTQAVPTPMTLAGWGTDKNTASDGTLWAEIGFAGGNTDEFYYVDPLATKTMFSLDFLSGPPSVGYPGPLVNELGTTLFGTGSLEAGQNGYVKMSDGDYKVLYAPVPAAVYPGLFLLMGLGALRRRMRRNAA